LEEDLDEEEEDLIDMEDILCSIKREQEMEDFHLGEVEKVLFMVEDIYHTTIFTEEEIVGIKVVIIMDEEIFKKQHKEETQIRQEEDSQILTVIKEEITIMFIGMIVGIIK
jgi:hypothetical protein